MSAALTALLVGFLLTCWLACGALLARAAYQAHLRGIARVRAAQARQDARERFIAALQDPARRPLWLNPPSQVPPQPGPSWHRHGHHDCPDGPDAHEDYCLNGRQE